MTIWTRSTTLNKKHGLPLKFACALLEEIVLAIHVDHAIFEDALPLVLDTGNLDR